MWKVYFEELCELMIVFLCVFYNFDFIGKVLIRFNQPKVCQKLFGQIRYLGETLKKQSYYHFMWLQLNSSRAIPCYKSWKYHSNVVCNVAAFDWFLLSVCYPGQIFFNIGFSRMKSVLICLLVVVALVSGIHIEVGFMFSKDLSVCEGYRCN